jgi:hypothetical protein
MLCMCNECWTPRPRLRARPAGARPAAAGPPYGPPASLMLLCGLSTIWIVSATGAMKIPPCAPRHVAMPSSGDRNTAVLPERRMTLASRVDCETGRCPRSVDVRCAPSLTRTTDVINAGTLACWSTRIGLDPLDLQQRSLVLGPGPIFPDLPQLVVSVDEFCSKYPRAVQSWTQISPASIPAFLTLSI